MGSGKLLKQAIEKYGRENFTKEILCICSTEEEMNQKEKEMVVISEQSYNLCEGGKGGFGYINKHGLGIDSDKARRMSELGREGRRKFFDSEVGKQILSDNGKKNYNYGLAAIRSRWIYSDKKKTIVVNHGNKGKVPWNKGKKASLSHIENMSKAMKAKLRPK